MWFSLEKKQRQQAGVLERKESGSSAAHARMRAITTTETSPCPTDPS